MSRILAIHNSHNASICEINNGNIIYFQEAERIDRRKKSHNWSILFRKYKDQQFDKIVFAHVIISNSKFEKEKTITEVNSVLDKLNIKCSKLIYEQQKHHFFHACCSFFNSGLKKSYVLVMDGSGSEDSNSNLEIISLYYFNKNKYKKIFQVFKSVQNKEYVDKKNIYINTISLGDLFEITKKFLGYKEEGSVMGLSCYSDNTLDLTDTVFKKFNHFQLSQHVLFALTNKRKDQNVSKTAICKWVQSILETTVLKYIKNINKNKKRNICVSGGVFQNTVLNSKLLDIVPNLYVDPFADDSGLSMGAALWYANQEKYKCNKIKTLFLGDPPDYSMLPLKDGINVSAKDIAKLIAKKNIVAIYQGKNETGKRALGNRSFLFDPRDNFGKEKINMLKNREWFRPTAGTVLFEHAHEWFDLKSKKETPFMSYVFNVKKEGVPGITHIDNTCRIQTLKKEQNFYYYNLINEFYKLTSVPMLLNTSFNLAGQPLINSVEDAVDTLMSTKNSFYYLYFPEIGKMYLKKYVL
tara:strand:- start:1647 stop:3218 length:1572 start_codon:yes stop_codon:yes gene_type:complete